MIINGDDLAGLLRRAAFAGRQGRVVGGNDNLIFTPIFA
jgi:hypothetical protein